MEIIKKDNLIDFDQNSSSLFIGNYSPEKIKILLSEENNKKDIFLNKSIRLESKIEFKDTIRLNGLGEEKIDLNAITKDGFKTLELSENCEQIKLGDYFFLRPDSEFDNCYRMTFPSYNHYDDGQNNYASKYPKNKDLGASLRFRKNPKKGHPAIMWWSGLIHLTSSAQWGSDLPSDPSANQLFFQII